MDEQKVVLTDEERSKAKLAAASALGSILIALGVIIIGVWLLVVLL